MDFGSQCCFVTTGPIGDSPHQLLFVADQPQHVDAREPARFLVGENLLGQAEATEHRRVAVQLNLEGQAELESPEGHVVSVSWLSDDGIPSDDVEIERKDAPIRFPLSANRGFAGRRPARDDHEWEPIDGTFASAESADVDAFAELEAPVRAAFARQAHGVILTGRKLGVRSRPGDRVA